MEAGTRRRGILERKQVKPPAGTPGPGVVPLLSKGSGDLLCQDHLT
jgi:hypothetical protein